MAGSTPTSVWLGAGLTLGALLIVTEYQFKLSSQHIKPGLLHLYTVSQARLRQRVPLVQESKVSLDSVVKPHLKDRVGKIWP